MKNPDLLDELTYKFVQECLASSPILVLGSGYSCSYHIPSMTELAAYIRSRVPKQMDKNDKVTWRKLEPKIANMPLEIALQGTSLSSSLTELIVRTTWDCISPADRTVFDQVIQNSNYLSLSNLYRHFFNSTNLRMNLVTTNYDCLAEYAIDAAGFAWSTGFGYGHIGHRYGSNALTVSRGNTPFRMVDIWKVHGSLNWFRNSDGITYCLPKATATPHGFSPVIVTPGIDKYKRTHDEPFRTIIAGADSVMENGSSFICIGYGFNDEHIQPKLLEKCRQGKTILVLSRELTESAKRVLFSGSCKHFMAFEESSEGTRMYSSQHLKGIELKGLKLWSLDSLLEQVL